MFDLLKIVNSAELDLSEDTWDSIQSAHTFGDCDYSLITWATFLQHCCEEDFDRFEQMSYNFVNL